MPRLGFLNSALLGILLTAAHMSPAKAAAEFQGTFCITAATATCGWGTGCYLNFRYTPRFLSDNGPSTNLSVFDGNYAANYKLAQGSLVGAAFQNVAGTGTARSVFTFTSKMRISQQIPAAPQTSTSNILVVGSIQGFDSNPNCTISFKGAGINTN